LKRLDDVPVPCHGRVGIGAKDLSACCGAAQARRCACVNNGSFIATNTITMRILPFASTLLAFACVAACAAPGAPAAAAPGRAATVPNAGTVTGSAKVTTPSGIVFESVQNGSGASPKASDTVRVHYRGTFLDGREFDSSYKRGTPTEFPLNRVIPCWTEAVQMMKPGGKARIMCPAATAYGQSGAGAVIPPNTPLMFEIELLAVQ
jgi:FKBP-type peptidyl-prolyl cis-trans isomerase FkpA